MSQEGKLLAKDHTVRESSLSSMPPPIPGHEPLASLEHIKGKNWALLRSLNGKEWHLGSKHKGGVHSQK